MLFHQKILNQMQQTEKLGGQIQNCSLTRSNEINQICYIYNNLIKLGYPKITKLTLTLISQIESYLNTYFYSTPSREHLIQWLLAIIYPTYRQTEQYKVQNDNISRLVSSLWKIGVLPVSKHTRNLDYHKYVMGLLGYQNSINLIYRMVQLGLQMVYLKKSKFDTSFGSFFHQAIDNFTNLINQNYDCYGITFPAKYSHLTQQQFAKKYQQFQNQKIKSLRQKLKQHSQLKQNQNQFEVLFENLSKNGNLFKQKYSSLIISIKKLNQKYSYLVKKQQKQPLEKRIQKRTLNISRQLCEKYKKMKKITSSIKRIPLTDQSRIKKLSVQKLIAQLNEVNLQNFAQH